MIALARRMWSMLERRWPLFAHPEGKRFVRFALVGGVNTVLDFSVFTLLHKAFGVHYLVANIFSFALAAVNSYVVNRRWTFRSRSAAWHREMAKYLTVVTVGFFLNEGILLVLVQFGKLSPLLAKALATVVVLGWNYGANRFWTFRHASTLNLPG